MICTLRFRGWRFKDPYPPDPYDFREGVRKLLADGDKLEIEAAAISRFIASRPRRPVDDWPATVIPYHRYKRG